MQDDFEGDAGRIDAGDAGEAGGKELLFVGYASGYEYDGDVMAVGIMRIACRTPAALEDAERQFTHQRLAVGRAFAGNHEAGVLQEFVKMDGVQQEVDA